MDKLLGLFGLVRKSEYDILCDKYDAIKGEVDGHGYEVDIVQQRGSHKRWRFVIRVDGETVAISSGATAHTAAEAEAKVWRVLCKPLVGAQTTITRA